MKFIKPILALLLLVVISCKQESKEKPPFWEDIEVFKKLDSAHFPGTGKILFVGSSSFTMWQDVQSYFPDYPIINRGFGGSTLPDLIRFEKDVIFKYNPKQMVIYCGENDLAESDSITSQMVLKRFTQLFNDSRNKFPDLPIAYISMKPSPSRQHIRAREEEGNQKISDFLKTKTKTVFIDVYHSMLNPDGSPIKEIFLEDSLHMNEKGYRIWQKLIEPNLIK